MARRFLRFPLPMLSAVLAAGGCDSSAPLAPSPSTGSAITLIVSDPARPLQTSSAATGAGLAANLHVNEGAAYVSAVPGTVAGATAVEVENLRLHQSAPATLVAGGFDPITIPAVVGDSLEFRFTLAAGGVSAVRAAVPARRRPRVVRTSPTRGRRDVAINSVIATVFSEPINPTTLRDSTVRLLRDGVAVRGTVRLEPGPVPGVEFVPAEPLLPATTYSLVFDGRIVDLAGDPLEIPDPVEFVTFGEGGTGTLTVITRTGGTDAPDGYDVMVDGRFAERVGVTDTVAITGLGAGGHHVLLSAMTEYCYATGGLYRQATLTRTQNATVTFDVTCTDIPKLELRVTTTGVELDEDGYQVTVNRVWSAGVPANDTLQLSAVRYGLNFVFLSGVRGNCRDAGTLRRLVDLSSGQAGTATFAITCTPDFTPAGRIAFAAAPLGAPAAIMVADADGSNRVQLTDGVVNDRLPAWSPDGNRIAFVRDREIYPDIYVMNADGSGLVARVTGFMEWIRALTWLPGANELAFSTTSGRVYVVPAHGQTIDAVIEPIEPLAVSYAYDAPGWSPVDARMAFASGRSLRITDRRGSFLREIRDDLTSPGLWSSPAWSPDGQRIAVFTCRDPFPGAYPMDGYYLDGECTKLSLEIMPVIGVGRTIVPLPGWIHRPVWSPDGSTFAYSPCEGCPGITYMRTDGRGTSVTIEDGFDPAWKP